MRPRTRLAVVEKVGEGRVEEGAGAVSDAKLNVTGRDFRQIWCD
jgi:hypothetical protein